MNLAVEDVGWFRFDQSRQSRAVETPGGRILLARRTAFNSSSEPGSPGVLLLSPLSCWRNSPSGSFGSFLVVANVQKSIHLPAGQRTVPGIWKPFARGNATSRDTAGFLNEFCTRRRIRMGTLFSRLNSEGPNWFARVAQSSFSARRGVTRGTSS